MIDYFQATTYIFDTLATLGYRENFELSNTGTEYQNNRKIGLVLFDENFAIWWNHPHLITHLYQIDLSPFSDWFSTVP